MQLPPQLLPHALLLYVFVFVYDSPGVVSFDVIGLHPPNQLNDHVGI